MRLVSLAVFLPFLALASDPGPPVQDNPNWFPFSISVMESAKTPIDLSFLNDKPAGVSGYLKAKGEHIVDGKDRQVRLFGTNFCFGANFPEAADAERVAAHLAKNGLNVVRLHHMDNDWGHSLIEHGVVNPNVPVDPAAPIETKLNTSNLAKLDKLVAELIKNGIYINLNLHVSRTYPGTPKGAPQYSKGLDYFHPPFIAAFKDYARQLLEHVNPHTGRAYKDEPGVAIIEMNNENTLVLNPWWMAQMEEPFAGELRTLFINHLRKKYPATDKLREVWGLNRGSTGPDLITNGGFADGTANWQSEANFGAKATLTKVDGGGIRWTSTEKGREGYSLQLSQPGLRLEESRAYRLSFRARSAKNATLDVHAQNSAPPWAQLGMQEKVQLKPDWQEFAFEFSPHSVLPDGRNRIVFSLLNEVTSVDITDVKLVSISTGYLKPEHSFEANNIPIPSRNAKLEVRRDFFDFLMQLEIEHALAMKKFIREEIGAKQMISHTALLFGGIVGARREFIVSDVVDTHGYWHHPHFPHKSWDMSDWEINNVSQITAEDGGTLAEMAMQRPVGKPYSVSEYDTPAPNDFAAETFPLLAAMACLQDWSAVYHFNFKGTEKYDSDKITSFFDLPGHPGKQAFMPLAALVFRTHGLSKANQLNSMNLSKGQITDFAAEKAGDIWGGWRSIWSSRHHLSDLAWATQAGFAIDKLQEGKPFAIEGARIVKEKTPGEPDLVVWSRDERHLLVGGLNGDKALVWCAPSPSKISRDHQGGALSITREDDGVNGILTLAALDAQPLPKSRKLWLCALSRAENQGMGWDKDRRTVGNQWGTGPALVLGVKAKIKLPGGATWKVEALDPTGRPKAVIADKTNEFRIDPSQKTVWWLITRE